MVDLWFAGLSLAAHKRLEPVKLKDPDTSIIVEGAIFDSESWRIQVIMLVAIAIEDNVEVVGNHIV